MIQRPFPFTSSNLNLFADLSDNEVACPSANFIANGFQPVAMNADGTMNSCASPAKFGSTVSFSVHGVGAIQLGFPPAQQLLDLQAIVGACSAAVENTSLVTAFVNKVDVRIPGSLWPCANGYNQASAENSFSVFLSRDGEPVGPRIVPVPSGPIVNFSPGQPMPMVIWVTR